MAKATKASKETKEEQKSIKAVVTKKINSHRLGFDLEAEKKRKNLLKTATFKKQEWYPLSPAFQEAVNIPGMAKGHINLLRGHSDTGKTTALIEAMIAVQKRGDLPVIIITEMKWSWPHAIESGFEAIETVDEETGELTYSGDFIYIDRGQLNTIEDVAAFIADIEADQRKGLFPVDIAFLWDSAGSIPCELSYASNKNNAMWNAGAMSTQFGNFINQKIMTSRKDSSKYTNTLIVINKIRVETPPPGSNPKVQPKMRNKAGDAMFWDATLILTFGNVLGPGTVKLKAVKDKKQVEWARIVNVKCDKNHITKITTAGKLVITPYGFIKVKEVESYKKKHSPEWAQALGSKDIEYVEEEDLSEANDTSEE